MTGFAFWIAAAELIAGRLWWISMWLFVIACSIPSASTIAEAIRGKKRE